MTVPSSADALLRRYRVTRDPALLGELFDDTAPSLFRIARNLVGDAALAEDVLQETFLAVIEGVESFDPARPAGPWLTGILRRQAARARRRSARTPDPTRLSPPTPQGRPDEVAAEGEDTARLAQALDELPEPYRGVALMRWRYGMEPAEIADVRGQAPGTIWSLLSRAKSRLRRVLVTAPAVLVGLRATREMAGVRSAVVRRAVAAQGVPAGVAGTTATAMLIGGTIVGKKMTVAACVALTLIAGGIALQSGWLSSPTPRTPPDVAQAAAEGRERRHTHPVERVPERSDESENALPSPVDLAAADRQRDLFGTTVDADGASVPGARLSVIRRPWREWSSMVPGAAHIETDGPTTLSAQDGTFTLRLRPRERVALRIECDGFTAVMVEGCQAGERIQVELDRGAALTLHVQEADGSPAAGVPVRIADAGGIGQLNATRSGLTDAQGDAHFRGLRAGLVGVTITRHDRATAPGIGVAIPESGNVERTYVLPVSRTLRGVVVDADTDAPIAGARIGEGWVQGRHVVTDASGHYELPGWEPGEYVDVSIYASGYVWQLAKHPRGDELDVRLVRGDWATGRVLDDQGTPIAGARVIAQGRLPSDDGSHFDAHSTVTSDEGTFAITGIDRDMAHTLVVSADGFGRTLLDFAPADPAGAILLGDVALPPALSISGVAYAGSGPLRAGIFVLISGGNPDRARLLGSDPPPGAITPTARRRTDDLGRFHFPGLAPGTYRLATASHQVDVILSDARINDVVLGVEGPPIEELDKSSIRFVVRDDTEAAIPYAEIALRRGSESRYVMTGADGSVQVDRLAVTEWSFSVKSPRGEQEFAPYRGGKATPAGHDVEVRLQRLGVIEGMVVDPDGKPLPNVAVHARNRGDGKDQYAYTRADGTFRVDGMAAESYDVTLTGDELRVLDDGTRVYVKTPYQGVLHDVSGPADGVVLRTHLPGNTRALTVRVVDADGATIPGVLVHVEGAVPQTTDATGAVRFVGVGQADARVEARAARGAVLPPGLLPPASVVANASDESVTLLCARGVEIEGRVVLPDGSACPDAMVVAIASDNSWRSVAERADDEGRFRLSVRPDEAHHIAAQWTSPQDERLIAIRRDVITDAVRGELELRLATAPADER